MSLLTPIASLVLAIIGIVLSRRPGTRRTVRMAVPLLAVPIAAAEAFALGQDALMSLPDLGLDERLELAVHAHAAIPATDAFGLTCAAVAVLAVAWAEAWHGELVDARAGIATALASFLAAGLVAGLAGSQGGTGPLALHPALFVVLSGLACAIAVAYRGDARESVARGLVVGLLTLSIGVLLVFIQDSLWLVYGTAELKWNTGIPAAVLLAFLAAAPILKHKFWEHPDLFGGELTIGLATAGAAMMLRMPVMFLMDRLLQSTPGGQIIALEKRLYFLPQVDAAPAPVDVLTGWMLDGGSWFGTTDGRPAEPPFAGDRLALAVRSIDPATSLTDPAFSDREVTLAIWVRHTEPDGRHPLAEADRYGLLEFTWMPTVPDTWSPSSPILVPEDGWTVQELIDACMAQRDQFGECRITPATS